MLIRFVLIFTLLMSTTGCETMRQGSGSSNPNIGDKTPPTEVEMAPSENRPPKSERLRHAARKATNLSWVMALASGGLFWAHSESAGDDGQLNGKLGAVAAVAGIVSFVSLYVGSI